MRDDYWNIFIQTGSVEAFLDYKRSVNFGLQLRGENGYD